MNETLFQAAHISYRIVCCIPGRCLTSPLPAVILKVAGSNLKRDRLYFLCVQEFPLQSDASIAVWNSRQSRSFTFRLLPTILTFCSNHGRNTILSQQIYLCLLHYRHTNFLIVSLIMAWQRNLLFLSRWSPSARKLNCLTLNTQWPFQILTCR